MAGNNAYKHNPPATKDACVVDQLRKAGAIPLPISTLPWMATSWNSHDEIGKRYTCNPYDVRRTTGGSSSGEGALVGAAASIFGLGNDAGGSIRLPASFCGVYGLKPTSGLVPFHGIVPSVPSSSSMAELCSIGPLCRHVIDLPTILRCLLTDSTLADTRLKLDEPVDLGRLRLFYTHEFDTTILCEPLERTVKEDIDGVMQFFGEEYDTHTHMVELPLMSWAVDMWYAWADRDEPPPNDSLVKVG